MDVRHPGRELRTTDAIDQSMVVLLGTLVDGGTTSLGPPGAHRIVGARFRIEQVLSPGAGGAPAGTVLLSYIRQVFPESSAEAELQRGSRYVMFCTIHPGQRLNAIKIVPYSDDAVRVVASAFSGGARHGADPGDRVA